MKTSHSIFDRKRTPSPPNFIFPLPPSSYHNPLAWSYSLTDYPPSPLPPTIDPRQKNGRLPAGMPTHHTASTPPQSRLPTTSLALPLRLHSSQLSCPSLQGRRRTEKLRRDNLKVELDVSETYLPDCLPDCPMAKALRLHSTAPWDFHLNKLISFSASSLVEAGSE